MIDRMDRLQKMLKREISVILQSEIEDPRVSHVTITRVELTRDLRLAKVFYITSSEEHSAEEVGKGLKSSGGFVRRELAERITLKYIPRISFRPDRRAERAESMNNLFSKIEEELGIDAAEEEGNGDEQG
ncbi:MAG: 30S ribosome-binding factor RbfA [Candidatus Omnitrophica bacterium]|nr:30S ribosome-binding factor RbfA [Candidatus Omnitrophota bacterium]